MATLHPLLRPYEPTAADPFDAVKAAHLLNRAGFGGLPHQVENVVRLGPAAAVEKLLDFPDEPAEQQGGGELSGPTLAALNGYPTSFRGYAQLFVGKSDLEKKLLFLKLLADNQRALQETVGWWLRRMAYGAYPLQEKLTLFWHGHFTTSAKDELAAKLMWDQNELLRRHAAGTFRSLVRGVSRDPAMLDYLNNQQNRRQHPNENYARELLELFTLGLGHYTEGDVKDAARAFTGWGHDGDQFVYRNYDHDDGPKSVLGRSGDFNGDDVIDVILQQPACPAYVAGRLFAFFAYEGADEALAAGLGDTLKDSGWNLRPLLRTLLRSRAFYGPRAIGTQIKSPVQLMIGAARVLGLAPSDVGGPPFRRNLEQMGQAPFQPPNVKGWPGGRMWISTSTLFARYNLAAALVPPEVAEIGALPARRKQESAEQVVDRWTDRLIQRPIDPRQRRTLLDALGGRPQDPAAVRKLVQLIVATPEYQLC